MSVSAKANTVLPPRCSAGRLLQLGNGRTARDAVDQVAAILLGEIDLVGVDASAAANVEAAVVALLVSQPFDADIEILVIPLRRQVRTRPAGELDQSIGD